jgi:hypothetical protein
MKQLINPSKATPLITREIRKNNKYIPKKPVRVKTKGHHCGGATILKSMKGKQAKNPAIVGIMYESAFFIDRLPYPETPE